MDGALGVKLGMTQRFREDGSVVPVTLLRIGPCVVLQRKTKEKDGYEAVQLGLVGKGRPKGGRASAARAEAAGVSGRQSVRLLREFGVSGSDDLDVGSRVGAELFSPDERVRVSGVSRGKGFAGVVRRYGFRGGPKSHGSKFHRAPGAIGMCATPSRVLPGTKLPGHMGHARVTVRNLQVVEVAPEQNLVVVRGAVPGHRGSFVEVRRA